MIKQVEEIFNEYENFKFVIPSNIRVVLNFLIEEWIFVSYLRYKYIIDDCVAFGDDLLPAHDYRINQYNDTEERILDGYQFCINLLFEHMNENNFVEIDKMRQFLNSKLDRNIANIEYIKKEIAKDCNFPTGVKYEHKQYKLEEDSLFVETFFVEKMKEIANVDLLKL